MYLHNKYTIWYYRIINNAKVRDTINGYFEKHHIIPKSLGGNNDKNNLVLLTGKEHYICHLLLTKMVEGNFKRSMSYALWGMVNQHNKHQDRIKITGRKYQYAKELMKESLSKARKGKTFEERFGKDKANKIKEDFKKRKTRNKFTDEEKKEVSNRLKNTTKSEKWKTSIKDRKISKILCSTCDNFVDPGNYSKHHKDDKCRQYHPKKICPVCSNEFYTTYSRRKYCSNSCYRTIYYANEAKR